MIEAVGAACLAVSLAVEPGMALLEPECVPQVCLTSHPTLIQMMKFQNQERARYGLQPLKMNRKMCVAAQKHATWMASTGYYMHSNLGWPEIIHSGPRTPRDAVTGWIYSPAHHSIMLSGTQAGFGFSKRNGVPFWVTVIQ